MFIGGVRYSRSLILATISILSCVQASCNNSRCITEFVWCTNTCFYERSGIVLRLLCVCVCFSIRHSQTLLCGYVLYCNVVSAILSAIVVGWSGHLCYSGKSLLQTPRGPPELSSFEEGSNFEEVVLYSYLCGCSWSLSNRVSFLSMLFF